jgi:CMP-N-acetylneuraminic acid synthetase
MKKLYTHKFNFTKSNGINFRKLPLIFNIEVCLQREYNSPDEYFDYLFFRQMNIALIPARSGSKRLPNKNIKLLHGRPLLSYSINSAITSGLFTEVIVSTDSEEIAEIAKDYGASVPMLRPSEYAQDLSCDIDWVNHALEFLVQNSLMKVEYIAILRPTSPLRKKLTMANALQSLADNSWADSLRAMQLTDKHPGKMWTLDNQNRATPYLVQSQDLPSTHDRPTQSLQKLWIQNASLEIVRLRTILETNSISGRSVLGFEMPGLEGFDINSIQDFEFLEFLIAKNKGLIQEVL